MNPLVSLLIALIGAACVGEILSCLRAPRVVGQICAGIILGSPIIKTAVMTPQGMELLSSLADIGVILLLFFTGLEVNFKVFRKNIKLASGISVGNTLLPLATGYFVVRYLFRFSPEVSFIIGVCLAVSSFALAIDVLEELKMLKTKVAGVIISAGTIDDLYELGLITIAISFIETVAAKAALITVIMNGVLLILAIGICYMCIIPLIFRFFEKGTEVTLLMSGLIITFLMAVISDALGFGTLIGALISGIIIRRTLLADVTHHRPWEAHEMSRNIHMMAFGFFVPIFFVYVGILTNIGDIWQNISLSMLITVTAMGGTVLGTAIVYLLSGKPWSEGTLIGWALNSKGDTEIVIATLALGAGVITQSLFSSLIFMAVMSTLISPIIFRSLLMKRRKMIA